MTTTLRYGYDDLPRLLALMGGDEKHDPSALSTLDVLWVLYREVLRVDPGRPDDPGRDRFLLSKGHGPMAYYAVLAAHGFLDESQLSSFASWDSVLGHHPDRTLVPGCEIGSGSLGHGLPLAVGTAIGLGISGNVTSRVVVLVGDAELQEGSNPEAIQHAGRSGLGQLSCVVVDNSSASAGWPGGVARRFEMEGWTTRDVDGRDHAAIRGAFANNQPDRLHCVVAHVEPKPSGAQR